MLNMCTKACPKTCLETSAVQIRYLPGIKRRNNVRFDGAFPFFKKKKKKNWKKKKTDA